MMRFALTGYGSALLAMGVALAGASADTGTRSAAAPAKPVSQTLRARYVVTWLGVPVLRGRFSARQAKGRYEAGFHLKSVGLVDAIMRLRMGGVAHGRISGAAPAPTLFMLNYHDRKEKRRVILRYQPDGSIRTQITPPEHHSKRKTVPAAMQAKTIDPVSALIAAAAQPVSGPPCRARARIFEGRRRLDSRLKLVRREPWSGLALPGNPRHVYRCHLFVNRLAGFRPRHMRRFPDPLPPAVIWYARLTRQNVWVPVEIAFKTAWGTMRARVTKLEITR